MLKISEKNLPAIIVWILAILGGLGFINPFGFVVLLVPFLFYIFGAGLTKNHAKEYLNVLFGAGLLYLIGQLLGLLDLYRARDIVYTVTYVYLLVTSILGIINALRVAKFKAPIAIRLLK